MRWHIELLIESVLFAILWRKTAPRWFSILIGVDLMAQAIQFLSYRAHYPMISRSFWITGVLTAGPLMLAVLIEAAELDRSRVNWWHIRILSFWAAAQLTCVTLQTQADLLIPTNHVLMVLNAAVFFAWIAVFMVL